MINLGTTRLTLLLGEIKQKKILPSATRVNFKARNNSRSVPADVYVLTSKILGSRKLAVVIFPEAPQANTEKPAKPQEPEKLDRNLAILSSYVTIKGNRLGTKTASITPSGNDTNLPLAVLANDSMKWEALEAGDLK